MALDYSLIISMIYICLKEINFPVFPKDVLNYMKKSPLFFKGIN